ncbi:hypothetical protein G7Y89_g11376 [Cudoniella acicularis]|uniref:Antifreeze protein n=1 Tax=Cudoniella acicularis TaxID=354080 RepID=A0A8H4W064_9HELO|nr:hypothetical protein G7Y89_g11376 [Cudoniella acicularis]
MFSNTKLALLFLLTTQFTDNCLAHPSVERSLGKRSPPVVMGAASAFGAIAASTLTSTGNTVITGDCGTSPGTSITGFPPGVCTGITSAGGTLAVNAEAACLTAYNAALASTPTTPLSVSNLGGLTLNPGVYTFPTSAVTLSGILTLNGTLNANGQFIFLIDTTFTTAVSSEVLVINGAQACNIYFIVGTSASIGAASALQGNLLAYTAIAAYSGASNKGTWCALNAAITLIDDSLTAITTCTT